MFRLACLLVGLAWASTAAAQTIKFDIQAGPLSEALAAFSAQARVHVNYKPGLTAGKHSPGVTGKLRPRAALRRVLAGTELTYSFSGRNTVILTRAPRTGAQRLDPIGGAQRLAPITVTGQKTTRSLQDTATSVSVITGEELAEDAGTATLETAISQTPNVIASGTGTSGVTIRGSDTTGPAGGGTAFVAGTRPRVTIQKDGRALTFNQYIFGSTGLWDVERVEVLRGPQTTLQGRNSIAGAIIIDTKDPSFEWEGKARLLVGNYDTRQLAGVVSGPITDELAFRLSANRRRQDSWVELTGPVSAPDPLQDSLTDIRGKLLYLPKSMPNFSAQLTLEHIETHGPQVEFADRPFDERENDAQPSFPVFETESDTAIVDLAYSVTPNWELRNTTVFTDGVTERFTRPGFGNARIESTQYSNELIAEYQAPDGDTELLLGTYVFHAETDETFDFLGSSQFDDETDAAAVFGQGSVTFFNALELTLGARYQYEQRQRSSAPGSAFPIDFKETYNAFLPKFGLSYRVSENLTYGATVERGFNPGGAGVTFGQNPTDYTYDPEFLWNYEVFFRSDWFNNRLRVNGNLFYADFEDQQRSTDLDPTQGFNVKIVNAEEAVSYGAELTATWLPPIMGLEIHGGLGLLETELERFDTATQPVEGNEFARAPGVNLTVGASYEHPSGWSLAARGRYVGDYFSDDANTPAERVDSYTLVDVDASYQLDEQTRIFAFVDNVFNSDAELLIFGAGASANLVAPREFGVGIEYTWQ